MKLLYPISVPATGAVELTVPIGIRKCKMRAGSNVLVENVGVCSNAGVNVTPDISFPIIDGKSPCRFKISQASTSETATTFYILITEIGGLPDPDYFTGGAASE